MADLLSFFENIPKEYRTIFLVGGLSVLTLLESNFPLLNFQYKKIKHISLNLFFTLTTVLINLAGASLILYASIQSELLGFGLLKFLDLPLVFEILFGIMFLAGFTPLPFKVFTITSGVIAYNLPVFFFICLFTRGLRFFLVSYLTFLFGKKFGEFIEKRGAVWFTLTGVFIVVLAVVLYIIFT